MASSKSNFLSISLLLKLIDTAVKRSHLMFLLHKFRPRPISKWSLLPSRRDLPTSDGSAYLTTEWTPLSNWSPSPLPRFLAENVCRVGSLSNENIASGFPDSGLSRWTWHQVLSSWVISLCPLCTCFSLLYYHCIKFPWNSGFSKRIKISFSLPNIQRWSQHLT